MKIGIIGRGAVGDAVYHGLAQIGHELNHYDIKDTNTTIQHMRDRDMVFVCVPTEAQHDGRCDTSIVEDVLWALADLGYRGIVIIKSTVPPGTTDRMLATHPELDICCVPEFLREKSAHTDFFDNHDVLIVGSHSTESAQTIVRAHKFIPQSVAIVKPIEAEISKYFNNVHNAMEIVFANAMYEVCQKLGADYQEILQAISHRANINISYLKCSENYRGYAGRCLPKDTLAWHALCQDLGLDISIFDSIVKDNGRYV